MSLPNHTSLCPCNSQKEYSACCEPYIVGCCSAPNAEALMRSRYTAYTQANIAYIQSTMCGKAAEHYDPIDAEQWAKSVNWVKLKVLRCFSHKTDASIAYVEFIARYHVNHKMHRLHELSEFHFIEGKWFYTGQK